GKCQRKDPPCKYLHPPQHLREQLLQNGRNNLILKNLQVQAYQTQYANIMPMPGAKTVTMSAVMPGQYSYLTHYPGLQTLSNIPGQPPAATYSPYLTSFASMPMPGGADPTSVMSQGMPANMIAAKAVRADKFEVCREFQRGTCSRPASECRYAHPADHIVVDATDNHVTVCMDFVKSKCTRDQCKYFHPPSHLQALVRAAHARSQAVASNNNTNSCSTLQSTVPGMMPAYKRIAIGDISKGGYPVYQTNPLMSPLQHTSLMHLQQQPSYIPMSSSGLGLYMMSKSSHSSSISNNNTTSAHGATHVPSIPNNAYHVEYFGSNKQ
ncbi:unnamed protein product, partial [Candidula unifasciata]